MGERRGGGLTIYKRESKDLTMVKFMDLKLKNRKQGTSAYPVALSGAAVLLSQQTAYPFP